MNISDEGLGAAGRSVYRSTCSCCGPWLFEVDGVISEFSTEYEAEAFAEAAHVRDRVARLARIHGITDEARIEQGVSDIVAEMRAAGAVE